MNYLLDSNIVSDFYDKDSTNHLQIVQQLGNLNDDDQVFVSIISLYELEYGYNNAPEDMKRVVRKKIEEAKEDFSILPLAIEGSICFGKLKKSVVEKRKLKKENAKKHNIDIILACTAVVNSCILISEDTIFAELKQIEPKLKTESWTEKETQ